MSYRDFYSGRWTTPSGWRPDIGTNDDTPPPDAASNGGGEFYEYCFRSGTGTLPQPRPPGPSDTTESSRLAEEVTRVTAEAIRVTAEAARLQAEVTRLAAENKELKEKLEGVTLERSAMDEEIIRKASVIQGVLPKETVAGTEQTMLICERVGSVSLDFWVGMSEARKNELNTILKTLVRSQYNGAASWESISAVIRNDLARVGISLLTADEFSKRREGAWSSAMNTNLPEITRATSFVDTYAETIKEHCYNYEIFKFLKRLMDLRHGN